MKIRRLLIVVLSLALPVGIICGAVGLIHADSAQATANTKYVSPNSVCGVVVPCYGSIQEAVDDSVSGDVIKVSQGVYTSVLSNVLTISKSIEILGGFSRTDWGDSKPMDQPTVIDGEESRRGIRIEEPGDFKVVLAGLTVRNGHAITIGGGGILVISGTVDINECYIVDNVVAEGTGYPGGGVAAVSSRITIVGSTIQDNKADSGGGLSIDHSTVDLTKSSIRANVAEKGGGLYVFGKAVLNMSANTVIGNMSPVGKGPGILLDGDSVIEGVNDIIADNKALVGEGEGVNIWLGNLTAAHWTLSNNDGYGLVASNGYVYLINTIVTSHTVAGIFGDVVRADTSLFYANGSNCSSGASCTGNLVGDPRFYDPENSDYHIMVGSAAKDTGRPSNVRVDFDGDRRPIGVGPDIGADEYIFKTFIPFLTKSTSER